MSPDCCDKDRHIFTVQKKIPTSSLTDLSALIYTLRCLPSRVPSCSNMHKRDGMRVCPQEIKRTSDEITHSLTLIWDRENFTSHVRSIDGVGNIEK